MSDKRDYLIKQGWTIGDRDPRINTDYPGSYMCAEPGYQDAELPTRDGRNGPWAIVGDNLSELIDEAHLFWTEFLGSEL